MRPAISALAFTLTGFVAGGVFFIAASLVLAWTGPTSAPPNGNVSAPINVGTTDQIKDAGLGINALAVFGNAIISTVSGYLNFGSTAGSAGYGIRDNAGVMEFKDSAGSWQGLLGTSSTFTQIKFADGTTQTTASGSLSCQTVQTGWVGPGVVNEARCPAGYVATGGGVDSGGNGYSPAWSHPSADGKGWIGLTANAGSNSKTYAVCCKLQ